MRDRCRAGAVIGGETERWIVKVLWYQSLSAGEESKSGLLPEGLFAGHEYRRAGSIGDLDTCLKQLGERPQVAVLWVSDRKELEQLTAISEDIKGVRTIVLLPDLEMETIGSALCLRPSFYASNSVGSETVRSVLEKIASQS